MVYTHTAVLKCKSQSASDQTSARKDTCRCIEAVEGQQEADGEVTELERLTFPFHPGVHALFQREGSQLPFPFPIT